MKELIRDFKAMMDNEGQGSQTWDVMNNPAYRALIASLDKPEAQPVTDCDHLKDTEKQTLLEFMDQFEGNMDLNTPRETVEMISDYLEREDS